MAKKKTVLKVNNSTKKNRKEILKAVAKVEGVEKLEMDVNKGTLTIVGEVEPVPIFKALKKIGQTPEIVNVGPPRPPQRCGIYCYCSLCRSYGDQQLKDRWDNRSYGDQQQTEGWNYPMYPCSVPCNRSWCRQCELVAVQYPPYPNESGMCSIQ